LVPVLSTEISLQSGIVNLFPSLPLVITILTFSSTTFCDKKEIESIPIFGNEIDEHEYNPKANINHKEE
jgi:hypothetical protein